MAKTKKLCFMAVLTAIALTIFMIENQLPSPWERVQLRGAQSVNGFEPEIGRSAFQMEIW